MSVIAVCTSCVNLLNLPPLSYRMRTPLCPSSRTCTTTRTTRRRPSASRRCGTPSAPATAGRPTCWTSLARTRTMMWAALSPPSSSSGPGSRPFLRWLGTRGYVMLCFAPVLWTGSVFFLRDIRKISADLLRFRILHIFLVFLDNWNVK